MAKKLPFPTLQTHQVDLSGLITDKNDLNAAMDRIYDNANDFEEALNKFADQVGDRAQLVFKKAVFMLIERLIMTTPVDTGRCMAAWQISVDSESDFCIPPGDYGDVDVSKFSSLPRALEVYNIENNTQYVLVLENGHSKQAPSGFIANALASFADYFAQAAESLGFEAT